MPSRTANAADLTHCHPTDSLSCSEAARPVVEGEAGLFTPCLATYRTVARSPIGSGEITTCTYIPSWCMYACTGTLCACCRLPLSTDGLLTGQGCSASGADMQRHLRVTFPHFHVPGPGSSCNKRTVPDEERVGQLFRSSTRRPRPAKRDPLSVCVVMHKPTAHVSVAWSVNARPRPRQQSGDAAACRAC